jgi:hypothetical protein
MNLWIADSGAIMLLLLGALCVFTPLKHEESQLEFFAGVFLTILLWASFVTFLTSLLSWIASRIFH